MLRTIKKVVLASISVLSISTLVWIVLLTNPTLSYAHKTQFNQVTVYHNNQLEKEVEATIKNAVEIIKDSEIYDDKFKIQFCLNDDKIYPHLHPTPGGTAYAFLNKTIIFASKPNFEQNTTAFKWEMNNNELRKYNLTVLIAHEFMHNLQYNFDGIFHAKNSFGKINWKFEGHADYIARGFKNDGRLSEKIEFYLIEETNEHVGIPVFLLEDGTIQNLSYFKFALVIQYLMEQKNMNYQDICNLEQSIEEPYSEMIEWYKNKNSR